MPRVKTCKEEVKGAVFEAHMNIDAKGLFKINLPGTKEDWPDNLRMVIVGKSLEETEREWAKEVRGYFNRTKVEDKVLVVRFDSNIRVNGKRDHFTDQDTQLILECAVAIRRTVQQGDKVNVSYEEPKEFRGLHSKRQPFPVMMSLHRRLHWPKDSWTVVPWTQELEDALVRACEGVSAIVHMLDSVLSTPEALELAAERLNQLPAPKNESTTLESHGQPE